MHRMDHNLILSIFDSITPRFGKAIRRTMFMIMVTLIITAARSYLRKSKSKFKKNKTFCSACVHCAFAFVVDVLTTVMRGKVWFVEPVNLYGEIFLILSSLDSWITFNACLIQVVGGSQIQVKNRSKIPFFSSRCPVRESTIVYYCSSLRDIVWISFDAQWLGVLNW